MNQPVYPYPASSGEQNKKQQVEQMFDAVAQRYDLLNHLLSFGIDHYWRWVALSKLRDAHPQTILDIATGTGDLALAAWRYLKPNHIIGLDLSANMLKKADKKITKAGLQQKIKLQQADSESLPFGESYFDAITVGFGVRNFEHLDQGLQEIARVLKPGCKAVILEFSPISPTLPGRILRFYFKSVLPTIGRLISGDKFAYKYLYDSASTFSGGQEFANILIRNGFSSVHSQNLTFGMVSIYTAHK